MKKRILALALAGTTAFSVFGAAMSANAANVIYWNNDYSSHVNASDDAYYQSYTAAGDIHWNTEAATTQLNLISVGGVPVYTVGQPSTTTLTNNGVGSYTTIAQGTTLYVQDPSTFKGSKTYYNVKNVSELSGYYTTLESYMTAKGYAKAEINADKKSFNVGNTKYNLYKEVVNGEVTAYYAYTDAQVAAGTVSGIPFDGNEGAGVDAGDPTKNTDIFYTVSDNGISYKVEVAILNGNKMNASLNSVVSTSRDNSYYIAELVDAGIENATNYFEYPATTNNIAYVINYTGSKNSVWTDSNYTALNPTVDDFDAVMDEEVSNGVVYLYDYYYDETYPARVDADTFADGWADGTLATTLKGNANLTSGVIEPETGYSYRSVRGDVLDAWEDFLDDLGIADASAKEITAWAKNIYANYVYTYYDTTAVTNVVYNSDGSWTITITNGKNVDLYNFGDLLEDILELAPAMNPDLNSVQTSEFVYLMQQYDKYTSEGFVDVNPVETDDWGDLLVALAQAPTEDEFATANGYKRYTNAVEDLVEQYEEADTAAAVSMAEQNLYDFVTDYNSAYKYSTKGDTTTLASSIDNTFFNYDWRKSYNDNTVSGAAEVYAGHLDTDGVMTVNMADKNFENSWALYPQADYVGTVSGANPGVDTSIANVTAEYYWFYNVYDLAYNVYTSNKYQSTLDLMATTLDEAVDALVPASRSTARASDVLGAEEANDALENLVEGDYITSMWANRTKINSFINDRVSNDEIGMQGTNNAEDIADKTAELMGQQQYQTVVTRSDINSVSTAKASAEAALTALENDQDNYNAAQATALKKAIDTCEYLIDIYNGDYATYGYSQTVNGKYNGAVGDKDQILKSDITNAVQAVDDAINFSSIIMGWSLDENDNWMYGTEEGYLNDGWHQVDGGKTWFYFNEDGTAKQSEWWQDGSTWYYFNSNCGAAVGWAKVDGNWYYFKGNNAMKTGWEKVDGCWYYMDASGKMVTGWCQIDGTWYYFSKESNALGQMLANTTTPDGYKVDANGALVD